LLTLKISFILLLQLNIFFIIGNCIRPFKSDKEKAHPSAAFLCAAGFSIYHGLFWIIAYPCALFDFSFSILFIIWTVVLSLLLALMIFYNHKFILNSYLGCFKFVKENPLYVLVFLLFAAFIVFLSTRNGYLDIDSQTYIGEVTTILGTKHIMSINPTTGLPLTRSLFLRRGCALFGAESAFWCRVFKTHPLIYCKMARAALNPILLFIGTYSLLRIIGFQIENAMLFIILSCPAFLLFDNSGYTNTRFLLHRGYEGKAYLSGTLIVITLLLCINYLREKNALAFLLLMLNEIATISISASSLYLIPPILLAVLGSYIIIKKEWDKIPLTLLLIVPNVVFAFLQSFG